MKLKNHYDEMVRVGGYKDWPVRMNSYQGSDILKKIENGFIKFQDSGSVNQGILSMILFGIDLPKCYFTEDADGRRTCIYGHSILSTIKAVLQNPDTDENIRLLNKVYDVVVPVITFEPSVPKTQIDSFLFHLKELC